MFWEPLALAALNQSIDQAEASHFIRVLERVFGPDPAAAALVLPAVPLDELYAEPARAWLADRGSDVRVNAPAKVVIDGRRIRGVRVRDEVIEAPLVISTVPWHSFHALFDQVPAGLEQTIANATALASLPIVTVNLWFDAAVMQEPLVGLPGRNFQWIFDRRAIVGGDASHLSLVSSGAEAIVAQTNDELTTIALDEVRDALPAARSATLRKSMAVREKRATFSLAPDAPPRPGTRTAVEGLLLAGDWIDTGLPATIESAVMSGHRAAGDRRVMISILVHYSELALKGKNRSWFVGRLVRHIHGALAGLHVKEVRTHIGRIEIVLGQDSTLPEVQRSPVANLRHRQLLGGHACAARFRGHGQRDRRATARAREREQFSRAGPSCRSEVRDALARPGARSRIARVARARLEGRSRSRRSRDPRRDRSRRGVLLHGPRPRRRRIADRHRRPAGRRCCPAASTRRWRRGA